MKRSPARLMGWGGNLLVRVLQDLAIDAHLWGLHGTADFLDRRAIVLQRAVLGAEHEEVASSLEDLAVFYEVVGRWPDAATAHREAYGIRFRSQGPWEPRTLWQACHLAEALWQWRRDPEALRLYADARIAMKRALGPDSEAHLDRLARRFPGIAGA